MEFLYVFFLQLIGVFIKTMNIRYIQKGYKFKASLTSSLLSIIYLLSTYLVIIEFSWIMVSVCATACFIGTGLSLILMKNEK